MLGRYTEHFWRVFGMCQEGYLKELGQCLEVILKVSVLIISECSADSVSISFLEAKAPLGLAN